MPHFVHYVPLFPLLKMQTASTLALNCRDAGSPVCADDDLAAVALALHLDAEPLPVLDLGGDRRVQRHRRAVVHAVALVPAHRPQAVRRHLRAVLQERDEAVVRLEIHQSVLIPANSQFLATLSSQYRVR